MGRPAAGSVSARAFKLLVVGMLTIPSLASAAEDLLTQLRIVETLHFHGVSRVPVSELKRSLRTRPPSIWPWADKTPFRRDFLSADTLGIRLVYRDHGFLDAGVDSVTVQTLQNPREVAVHYYVHEGEQAKIRSIKFDGIQHLTSRQLMGKIYAHKGKAFNPAFLAADTARISAAFKDRGYIPDVSAEARRDTRDSLKVDIRYMVVEGPLYRYGEVYLSTPGQTNVNARLVRRELLMKPGEVFRISKVEESQQRLYDTGLFSQVQVTPLPDSTNKLVEFDLRVRERKPRWIDAGVGSGTTERFRFTADWGHHNILGRGLQGVIAGNPALSLDYKGRFIRARGEGSLLEPWLFGFRTSGQVTIYDENGIDRTDTAWVRPYDQRGVSFLLSHSLGLRSRAYLVQDNSWINQSFILSKTDSVTLHRLDSLLTIAPTQYSTHRIEAGYDRDARDSPINTLIGSMQSASWQIAGGPVKNEAFRFTKWQGFASWYRPRGTGGWVVATRLRGGLTRPFGASFPFTPEPADADVQRVPNEDRFRIGGVNSLRGYVENELPSAGGLVMMLGNIELRIPVIGPFGVELFVDAGNVWSRPSYLKAGQFLPRISAKPMDPSQVRWVAGVGPRLNLPFGPLRVDFSWGFRPEPGKSRVLGAQFAIGPTF